MDGEAAVKKTWYLRLSITDGCAFRCPYCQPGGVAAGAAARGHLLAPSEIERTARALAGLGATRVRLTGGEPLSRPECAEIVSKLRSIPEIREIALTTNGERLAQLARPLKDAGLGRINVHVDSLDPGRFSQLSGGFELGKVLSGIDAALEAGLSPLKVNVVLMRGINDGELWDFCRFAKEKGVRVRFIELMNTGPSPEFVRRHFFSAAEARRKIGERHALTPRFEDRGASPAREYLLDGGPATLGFIASETEPFCEACNRIRLTADGKLKVCLYDPAGLDVRGLLRNAVCSDGELEQVLGAAIGAKRSYHPDFGQRGERPFSMARVGG
ncbi:MAG: GTP 3',8-cyclase MoaA [Bdellovibrionota bacterium]